MYVRAIIVTSLSAILILSGWTVRGWKEGERYAELREAYAKLETAMAEAAQKKEAENRRIETEWQDRMEALNRDHQKKLEAVIVESGRAANSRLQQYADDYANRADCASENPDLPRNGPSASPRVLAELLGESDRLAEVFAREADTMRIVAESCTDAYSVLKPPKD